jgi:hypothetical protein
MFDVPDELALSEGVAHLALRELEQYFEDCHLVVLLEFIEDQESLVLKIAVS